MLEKIDFSARSAERKNRFLRKLYYEQEPKKRFKLKNVFEGRADPPHAKFLSF